MSCAEPDISVAQSTITDHLVIRCLSKLYDFTQLFLVVSPIAPNSDTGNYFSLLLLLTHQKIMRNSIWKLNNIETSSCKITNVHTIHTYTLYAFCEEYTFCICMLRHIYEQRMLLCWDIEMLKCHWLITLSILCTSRCSSVRIERKTRHFEIIQLLILKRSSIKSRFICDAKIR